MKKIAVLVVDDSAFMRKVISDMILLNNELEVVGTAKNGQEAIRKITELSPSVVTMDVEMPTMDGIQALKYIMEQTPLPIVMISSVTKEGTESTVRALELGAVDFITKPSSIFKMSTEDMKKELHEKIKMAAKVNVKSKVLNRVKASEKTPQNIAGVKDTNITSMKKIVAIGTSTGGPRALQSVIPYLPRNIPACFLIVQHMPPGFTKSLAERLNNLSQINVKEAEDGDVLQAGWAYIAPGDYHLRVVKVQSEYKIKLTKEDPVSGHRPSVDMMMHSLAELGLTNLIGVIMTGMGSDGAEGMKSIKQCNGYTIGQNEETCVVYGMPKSAINLGCVDAVVGLDEIAETIIKGVGV